MPEDLDSAVDGPRPILRSLERAVAVARRRRRFRLGLVLVLTGTVLLGALVRLLAGS